ncbi:hypothetical protein FBLNLFFT_0001 [Klebsiella phage Amrap]|uniref:Uncharacterized protein n=1 Tax=Klebsiella phage Amrap TaxID=3018530 RepID=A0AAF0D8G2_9CAUD|nr:hypothetical protein FBLNLFFT_0001 [Klebsiella phage Amrap]
MGTLFTFGLTLGGTVGETLGDTICGGEWDLGILYVDVSVSLSVGTH